MPIFFPIMLEVEETMLGPVLRMLKDQPGVKMHLNLDGAGKKPVKRLANGHERVPRKEGPRVEDILISELMTGQKNLQHLRNKIVEAGKSPTAVSNAIHALQKKGVTESAGLGIHRLTDRAMEELRRNETPQLAAPAQAKRARSPLTSKFVLDAIGKGMSRAEMIHAGVETGLSKRALESSLTRLTKQKKLVRESEGRYRLATKSKSKSKE